MAEGVIGSIFGGIAAPVVQPVIRRLELRRNRQRQVSRPVPAIIFEYRTYSCHNLDRWIREGKDILRHEPWVREEFWSREVPLRKIAPALVEHKYWELEDARFFENKSIEIVGPEHPGKRLGLILWGIREGFLKAAGTSAGTRGGAATSASQAVDGAVDIRLQDSAEASRARVAALQLTTPDPGVPISVSKIIVPMVIDIRQTPTPTLLISERVARDLGSLLHDPRGAFEVEVQCTLSHSLSEIVGRMDRPLLPRTHSLEIGLMDAVEDMVHDFTCFTAENRYNRPVRPAAWPSVQVLGSLWGSESTVWFNKYEDGQEAMVVTGVGRPLGKVSVNSKRKLAPELPWAVEALKLLGGRVQYEEHEFGLIWITEADAVTVILGQAELSDAMRHKDKLASTYSNGWNAAGARVLNLIGWHDGPDVEEVGQDWLIRIYGHDAPLLSDVLGYFILSALPLNLC